MEFTAWVEVGLGSHGGLCKGFAPHKGVWSRGGARRVAASGTGAQHPLMRSAMGGWFCASFMRLVGFSWWGLRALDDKCSWASRCPVLGRGQVNHIASFEWLRLPWRRSLPAVWSLRLFLPSGVAARNQRDPHASRCPMLRLAIRMFFGRYDHIPDQQRPPSARGGRRWPAKAVLFCLLPPRSKKPAVQKCPYVARASDQRP